MSTYINPNPVIHQVSEIHRRHEHTEYDDTVTDAFDALEIFELIRKINDPEHPTFTLEQLKVLKHQDITVDSDNEEIRVMFTPTVPHCSMATLIGLCIRVKLMRSLPERFKIDIEVVRGSHASETAVNKQLNDKERVAAALENASLLSVVTTALLPLTNQTSP